MKIFVAATSAALVATASGLKCKALKDGKCWGFETVTETTDLDDYSSSACPTGDVLFGEDVCSTDYSDLVAILFDGDESCTDSYVIRQNKASGPYESAGSMPGAVGYLPYSSGDGRRLGAATRRNLPAALPASVVFGDTAMTCASYPNSAMEVAPSDYDDCAIPTCDGKLKPARCIQSSSVPSDLYSAASQVMDRYPFNFEPYVNRVKLSADNTVAGSNTRLVCDVEVTGLSQSMTFGNPSSDVSDFSRISDADKFFNAFQDVFEGCASYPRTGSFEFDATVPVGTEFTDPGAKVVLQSGSNNKQVIEINGVPLTSSGALSSPFMYGGDPMVLGRSETGDVDFVGVPGVSFDVGTTAAVRWYHPYVRTAGSGTTPQGAFIDVLSQWSGLEICDGNSGTINCEILGDKFKTTKTTNNLLGVTEVGTQDFLCNLDPVFGIQLKNGGPGDAILDHYECHIFRTRSKSAMQTEVSLPSFPVTPPTLTAAKDGYWCMEHISACVRVSAGDELACSLGAAPFDSGAVFYSSGDLSSTTTVPTSATIDNVFTKCALFQDSATPAAESEPTTAVCGEDFGSTLVAVGEGESNFAEQSIAPDWKCGIQFTIAAAPASQPANLFRIGNQASVGSGKVDTYRLPQVDLNKDAKLLISYTVADENGQPIVNGDKFEVFECLTDAVLTTGSSQTIDIEFFEEVLTIKRNGGQISCEGSVAPPPMYVPSSTQDFQVSGAGLFAAQVSLDTLECKSLFTNSPTVSPTAAPSTTPTASPTANPTASPTASPTVSPTASPSASPSASPTGVPTVSPSATPTASPTSTPTFTDLDFNEVGQVELSEDFICDVEIIRSIPGTISMPDQNGGVFRVGDAVGLVEHQNLPTVLLTDDFRVIVKLDVTAIQGGVPTPKTDEFVSTTAINFNERTPVTILFEGSPTNRLTISVGGVEDVFTTSGPLRTKVDQVNAELTAHPRQLDAVGFALTSLPECGPFDTKRPTAAPIPSPTVTPTVTPTASPSEPIDTNCVDTKLLIIKEDTFNAENENPRLLSHDKFLSTLLGSLPIGDGVDMSFGEVGGGTNVAVNVNAAAAAGPAAASNFVEGYLAELPPSTSGDPEVNYLEVLEEANRMTGFDPDAPDANANYDKTVVHIVADGSPVAYTKSGSTTIRKTGIHAFRAACDMRKLQRIYLRDDLLVFCQLTDRSDLNRAAKRTNKCVCDGTFKALSDIDSGNAAVSTTDDVKTEEEAAERMRTFFCRTAEEITTTDPSRCPNKTDKDSCIGVKSSSFGKPVRPDVSDPYSLLFRTGRGCQWEGGNCVDKPEQLHNVDGGLEQ